MHYFGLSYRATARSQAVSQLDMPRYYFAQS